MEHQTEFRVRKSSSKIIIGYEWQNEFGGWLYRLKGENVNTFTIGVIMVGMCEREQWTTFKTVDGEKIYVGDIISASDPSNKAAEYSGTVVFDAGCFSLLIARTNSMLYDVSSKPPLYDLCKFRLL